MLPTGASCALGAAVYLIFGLIRSGIEPTIYRTRGTYTNHYTTDAVQKFEDTKGIIKSCKWKDRQYNGQKKKEKQNMILVIL